METRAEWKGVVGKEVRKITGGGGIRESVHVGLCKLL